MPITEKQKKYFDKSGDEKIFTQNMVENDHGFYSYSIENGVLSIINVFGDGRYWEQFSYGLCREHGCNKIRFSTRRNPEAFARKFKAKVVGYIIEKEV